MILRRCPFRSVVDPGRTAKAYYNFYQGALTPKTFKSAAPQFVPSNFLPPHIR